MNLKVKKKYLLTTEQRIQKCTELTNMEEMAWLERAGRDVTSPTGRVSLEIVAT